MVGKMEMYKHRSPATIVEKKFRPPLDRIAQGPQGLGWPNVNEIRCGHDLFDFIAKFVVKIYGISAFRKFCMERKGKSFMDKITPSDIAFTLAVIENGREVWEQEYHMKHATEEELEKYKNPQLEEDESLRQKYIKKYPKFTSGKKQKRMYLQSCWNDEGMKYYKDALKVWTEGMADGNFKRWMDEKWDTWVQGHNFGGHWRKKKIGPPQNGDDGVFGDDNDQDDSGDEACVTLPGDGDDEEEDGFTNNRSKNGNGRHDTNEEENYENGTSNRSGRSLSGMLVETAQGSGEEAEESYDESGSSDESEEEQGGRKHAGNKSKRKNRDEYSSSSEDEEDDDVSSEGDGGKMTKKKRKKNSSAGLGTETRRSKRVSSGKHTKNVGRGKKGGSR